MEIFLYRTPDDQVCWKSSKRALEVQLVSLELRSEYTKNIEQPSIDMIPNHTQFIDAIREKNLIRIVFYSLPDAGTVDRECMPLDYGPQQPGTVDTLSRYWIWDPANTAGANPLGLLPGQIVTVQVLSRTFAPKQLPLGDRTWNVLRGWAPQEKSIAKQ